MGLLSCCLCCVYVCSDLLLCYALGVGVWFADTISLLDG